MRQMLSVASLIVVSDAPWSPEVNNEEIAVNAVPSEPRFLLQELIFTHRPSQSRPCLSGNLSFRVE